MNKEENIKMYLDKKWKRYNSDDEDIDCKCSNELLGHYVNGNYYVDIFTDGTKIRRNNLDNLTPSFAESCDVTITERCNGRCPFCYAGCTEDGIHGDILNKKFIETLHPYTELAINVNDLTHPDLQEFLTRLREKRIIANITINQKHFTDENIDILKGWEKKHLFWGIGISLSDPRKDDFLHKISLFKNSVVHVIAGIITKDDLYVMKDHNVKILILGYKHKGRGDTYYDIHSTEIDKKINELNNMLPIIKGWFNVVAFDNLGLYQINNVKKMLSDRQWKEIYMGDDGIYTFYIDMVNDKFYKSSIETKGYDIKNNIDDMFDIIKQA